MIYKIESPDSIKEAKEVEGHITRINRAVQNVFSSLDAVDNFSTEELQRYEETKHNISLLDMGAGGLYTKVEETEKKIKTELKASEHGISLLVSKGDVTNSINLSSDTLEIKGERLEIASPNFVLTKDRAVAKGEIVATSGNIAGWEIQSDAHGSSWYGKGTSMIEARNIFADYGDAKEINAYGDVYINATFKGNFEDINVNNAKFLGSISCSAMESNGRLTCYAMRLHTTQRQYGEKIPSRPEYPDKEEVKEFDETDKNYKHYNTNSSPVGGLLVYDNVECKSYYSKLAGKTYSDRRLKENIRQISAEEGYKLLDELKPCSFVYKESGISATGFIAQETPEEYRKEIRDGLLGLEMDSITACLDSVLKDMGEKYGRVGKD